MKNKIIVPVVLLILLTIALGCGAFDSVEKPLNRANSNVAANKTLADQAIETAVGVEKIGVPECDDLLESLAEFSNSPDDSYVTKAARQYALNKIRENIKRSVEENKNDKTQMAKECKEYRAQLEKFKTQEVANQK
jgi:hypothetical protein